MCSAISERLAYEAPVGRPAKTGSLAHVPWACALLAAATVLSSETARAEDGYGDLSLLYHGEVPEDPYSDYGPLGDDIEIPANGALLVDVECAGDCDGELDGIQMHVVDAEDKELDGEIVDGRLSDGSGWIGWKPTRGFERGATFRVVDRGGMSLGPKLAQAQFKATSATETTTPSRPALVLAKVVELEYQGKYHCCEEVDPEAPESESCSFIATDAKQSVNVYLALGQTAPDYTECPGLTHPEPLVAPQHVYHARRMGDETSTQEAEWTSETEWVLNFPVQDEYCFEVVARHVATGTETILESRCDGNERIEFPHVPRSVQMQNAGAFAACTVPPEDQKASWCSTYAEAIREQSCDGYNEAACQAALASCPSLRSDLGVGGAGGAMSEVDDGFDQETTVDASTGCSVAGASGPGAASSWQLVCWMLSAMGIFGLIWRRRIATGELQRVRSRRAH